MRSKADIGARRCWQQPIASTNFFLAGCQVQRGGHVFRDVAPLAVAALFKTLTTDQIGLAQVVGLVAEDGATGRILEGHGIAEDAVLARLTRLCTQRVGRIAPGINTVCGAHQHPVFHGGYHARSAQQRLLVHHQRLSQEGFDQVLLEGRQRCGGQAVGAGARRDAYGLGFAAGRGTGAQTCVAIFLFQVQGLSRKDQVGVGNGLHVHTPQLGPTPWALEVHARYSPEGVATLDDVGVGRVGGKLCQGDALLGHLFSGGPLCRADGCGLCHGRLAGQHGTDEAHCAQGHPRHTGHCSHVVPVLHV